MIIVLLDYLIIDISFAMVDDSNDQLYVLRLFWLDAIWVPFSMSRALTKAKARLAGGIKSNEGLFVSQTTKVNGTSVPFYQTMRANRSRGESWWTSIGWHSSTYWGDSGTSTCQQLLLVYRVKSMNSLRLLLYTSLYFTTVFSNGYRISYLLTVNLRLCHRLTN